MFLLSSFSFALLLLPDVCMLLSVLVVVVLAVCLLTDVVVVEMTKRSGLFGLMVKRRELCVFVVGLGYVSWVFESGIATVKS